MSDSNRNKNISSAPNEVGIPVGRHRQILNLSVPGWEPLMPTLCRYFQMRCKHKVVGDGSFGVVFAVTQYCNLTCKHCAVSARYTDSTIPPEHAELSTDDIVTILDKVARYGSKAKLPVFFMFGGGEPTLRADFSDILHHAACLFGNTNVGFCTNGTFRPVDEILSMSEDVGLLEVSLDGGEQYHNSWRTTGKFGKCMNAYLRTMELVKAAVQLCPGKLEVTSVATKQNLTSLPDFARSLRDLGVINYSVHRPIPVGRMAEQRSAIPGVQDYFQLLVQMAKLAMEDENFHVHLHHSLESIYSTLFIGADIHWSPLPMGSKRDSIGIKWDGSVHFDPWSLVPPFSGLSPDNLLEEGKELEDVWKNDKSILSLVAHAKKANVRCRQCPEKCRGGMRLSAMAEFLAGRTSANSLSISDVVAAVSNTDPACPLSTVSRNFGDLS